MKRQDAIPLLDEFGALLMDRVRDSACEQLQNILTGEMADEYSKELSKNLGSLDRLQKMVIGQILTEAVDLTIAHFLGFPVSGRAEAYEEASRTSGVSARRETYPSTSSERDNAQVLEDGYGAVAKLCSQRRTQRRIRQPTVAAIHGATREQRLCTSAERIAPEQGGQREKAFR